MSSLAELIYEETRTLAEPEAQAVLDFIGSLKHRQAAVEPAALSAPPDAADRDWAEFEQLAGAWSGRFDREACYDRTILR